MGPTLSVLGVATIAAVVWLLVGKIREDMRGRERAEALVTQQDTVRTFAETLKSIQEEAPAAVAQYRQALGALAMGKEMAEVRAAVAGAAASHKRIQDAILALDAPTLVPREVAELLRESRDALLTGYSKREGAVSLAAACLDHPKPDTLWAVEQTMKEADEELAKGVKKLAEAKQKLGIAD